MPPPLYNFGAAFAGLPLTERYEHPDGRSVDFIYGDCDPGGHGCAPPLDAQNWRLRDRHPRTLFGSCRVVSVRGVPAAFFQLSGGLDVYIGRRVVVVFADRPRFMLRAARALRRASAERPPRRHPRPPASVYRALRRCASAPAGLTG